jgi:hypothetical protein
MGGEETLWKGNSRAMVKVHEQKTKTKKQTKKEQNTSWWYTKISYMFAKGQKCIKLELAFAEWERDAKFKSKSKDCNRTGNMASPHMLSFSLSLPCASFSPTSSNQPCLFIDHSQLSHTRYSI